MDFIHIILSPLVLGSILLSTVLLVMHVVFDHKKATAERWYRKKTQGRKRHSFTVVIDLAKRADTVIPLLDHLTTHNMSKLEVIVLVRHTAGPRAAKQLREYRRTCPFKLRIVMHKKGLTMPRIISRYGASELIVQLSASDRVSQDFFVVASTYFRDNSLDLLMARRHSLLDATLSSALQATVSVWRDAVWPIESLEGGMHLGGVYRRRALLVPDRVLRARYASNLYFTQAPEGWRALYRQARSVEIRSLVGRWCTGYAVVGAVFGMLVFFMNLPEVRFVLVMLVVGYGLIFAAQLKGVKAYSVTDQVLLILFSPFSLVCIAIFMGMVHLSSWARRSQKLGAIGNTHRTRVHSRV